MSKTNFTIGADPEVFIVNKTGKIISSIGKIGGSKKRPRELGNGFFVQEDNVLMEFNIPPASSKEEFSTNIEVAKAMLEKLLPEDHSILVAPSAMLEPDQLYGKAFQFGCDSDINAWSGQQNPLCKAPKTGLRSGGGHVHVGINDISMIDLVKAMDLHIGVPSVLVDTDVDRRSLYGKAGAFRYKDFGVEYRTPSNFWIQSKELCDRVYDGVAKSIEFVKANKVITDEMGEMIQEAINTSDRALAVGLLHEYKIAV